MKIVIDSEKKTCQVGKKTFGIDMNEDKQKQVESVLRQFLIDNTQLSDYDEDCMWMSYRYCVGRHTIASHMHARDIWINCRNRMSNDRQLFTAYDINKEIENSLRFSYPEFSFPTTPYNKIYATAVDIYCQFMEDYNIQSKEDLLKYKSVDVILTDNGNGYKLETTTWEEYLRPKIIKIFEERYGVIKEINDINEDACWNVFLEYKNNKKELVSGTKEKFDELIKQMPNIEYFYMLDFEDLFVWNDLVHCFDFEHHHKSTLIDGTECEWFWTWTNKTEQHEDGYHYRTFRY